MNVMKKIESPPKARIAVRVGVTGHRLNGLDKADIAALRVRVNEVLEHVRDVAGEVKSSFESLYTDGGPPVLRIISPLADGADTLVAEEALAEGFELQCALPFARQEYEKDFTDGESLGKYRTLLGAATSILELDGSRATTEAENESYQTVGRMVLAQSDVLIAIWDGEDAKGKGGTGQIVKESLVSEIPVVWINSVAPHDIMVLMGGEYEGYRKVGLRELELRLKRVLKPEHPKKPDLSRSYFNEKQPVWTWGFIFEAFCDIFAGDRIDTGGARVGNFNEASEAEWQKVWDSCPDFPQSVKEQINEKFLAHYTWADGLANYYSNIYRSSFVANYLMAGLAVFFALLPVLPSFENLWILCELALIILIILITAVGNLKHWHERWIDYRLLSEQIRHLRFLAPLGLTTPAFRVPAHDTYGDPRSSWVNWHFRAIVREAGIVGTGIDKEYLTSYRDFLSSQEISAQIDYHNRNSPRFHRIHRNLHLIGGGLFVLTLLACLAHLYVHSDLLTILAAVLPAFGAAFYGIRTHGEFELIAKRSDAMSAHLENLKNELDNAAFVPSYRLLGYIAENTAEVMSSETLDWRIVFQSKRLVLPG
ncbi:MAG TPA: DUF4231 domain-containing protein [Thermodesulfobacteriota bacterium]|nr:DUF4231 domain-containing protein [Thermodesulfobacteriota bacterium]